MAKSIQEMIEELKAQQKIIAPQKRAIETAEKAIREQLDKVNNAMLEARESTGGSDDFLETNGIYGAYALLKRLEKDYPKQTGKRQARTETTAATAKEAEEPAPVENTTGNSTDDTGDTAAATGAWGSANIGQPYGQQY